MDQHALHTARSMLRCSQSQMMIVGHGGPPCSPHHLGLQPPKACAMVCMRWECPNAYICKTALFLRPCKAYCSCNSRQPLKWAKGCKPHHNCTYICIRIHAMPINERWIAITSTHLPLLCCTANGSHQLIVYNSLQRPQKHFRMHNKHTSTIGATSLK